MGNIVLFFFCNSVFFLLKRLFLYWNYSSWFMNCANLPTQAAVAQYTECGKGLCVQCVRNQQKPLCAAWRETLKSLAIGSTVFHLLVYVGLFIGGYKWNFMEGDGFPDGRLASGYMLMAIVSGWQFLNSVVGWRLVQGELTTWAIYYVLKLLLSVIIGFFTAPFTILWNLIKLIRFLIRR